MAQTTFKDFNAPAISASWLNDVDAFVYGPSGSTGPVLKTDLAASSGAGLVGFVQAGVGAVARRLQAKNRDTVSVKDFGAVGDGVADDTAAINAAIAYVSSIQGGGKVVIPSGLFLVSGFAFAGIAVGAASLVLLDNVALQIDGTLRVKNSAYGSGALYGVIRSLDTGLSNASISGTGIIDGNKANQIANNQASNVFLNCRFNVSVSGVSCVNANGMGVQIVSPTGQTHRNCSVTGMMIDSVTNIGLQISQGLSTVIADNRISNCVNNCIDTYGDVGTIVPANGLISITGNVCSNGLVGIFPETSSRCVVSGNTIDGCQTGVAVNRINGSPKSILITGNVISNCPTGVSVTGDTTGVSIQSNMIESFSTVGILIGNGSNVSYFVVTNNTLTGLTLSTNLIVCNAAVMSFGSIRNNFAMDSHNPANGLINTSGTTASSVSLEPIVAFGFFNPTKQVFTGGSVSGGTAAITVPAGSAGRLFIKSSAGGGRYSYWAGSYVNQGVGGAVTLESTNFVATQNNIVSVTASLTTNDLTITFVASGSVGIWNAWIEYT